MKADINGTSTCPAGEEHYESFFPAWSRNKTFYQYEYRTPEGDLFTCVASTLDKCREKRDNWINTRFSELSKQY